MGIQQNNRVGAAGVGKVRTMVLVFFTSPAPYCAQPVTASVITYEGNCSAPTPSPGIHE